MPLADPITLYIAHMTPLLAPTTLHGRVPTPRPDEFHHLRRIGGPGDAPVRELVRFDVFTWAETDLRVEELHRALREATWALAGTNDLGVMVYDVAEFKGPGSSDDPETDTPRIWATYDLTIRADEIITPAPALSP